MTITTNWPADEPILELPVDDPDAQANIPTAELTEGEVLELESGPITYQQAIRQARKPRPIHRSSGLARLVGGMIGG